MDLAEPLSNSSMTDFFDYSPMATQTPEFIRYETVSPQFSPEPASPNQLISQPGSPNQLISPQFSPEPASPAVSQPGSPNRLISQPGSPSPINEPPAVLSYEIISAAPADPRYSRHRPDDLQHMMLNACKTNNIDLALSLIGVSPGQEIGLSLAYRLGFRPLVSGLLQNGVLRGYSLLHPKLRNLIFTMAMRCVARDDLDTLQLLWDHGLAQLCSCDLLRELHIIAAARGNLEVLRRFPPSLPLLRASIAHYKHQALGAACRNGQDAAVRFFVDELAVPASAFLERHLGHSSLEHLCLHGRHELVAELCQRGYFPPEFFAENSSSVLLCVTYSRNVDLFELVSKAIKEVNQRAP